MSSTPAGTVIVVNGASSAGKSTLVRALQDHFAEPHLELGLDRMIWALPARYLERPLWDDVLGRASRGGEQGHRLVEGLHAALRALSGSGLHLIADHVLVEESWVASLCRHLHDREGWLIGLHCPLELLEQRERARKDRTLGQARAQFDRVHRFCDYDLTVNSALQTPEEMAAVIAAAVGSGARPQALPRLWNRRSQRS